MYSLIRFKMLDRKHDRISHFSWDIVVKGTKLPPDTSTIGAVNMESTRKTVNKDDTVYTKPQSR